MWAVREIRFGSHVHAQRQNLVCVGYCGGVDSCAESMIASAV